MLPASTPEETMILPGSVAIAIDGQLSDPVFDSDSDGDGSES